jgi:hypothetical protein
MNSRAHVSLIYRFDNIEQVKAHVRVTGERRFFFYRDPLLRLSAGTKVTIEWNFATGDATRLLQGTVTGFVENCGVWIELLDARPLRDLGPSPYTRRSRRMATNLEIAIEGQSSLSRMLDLSQRGARLTGVLHAARGAMLRLGIPTPGGPVEPLGMAIVTWCEGGECGVRFERRDPAGSTAVALLVKEIKEGWARAWHATHPSFCCRERGVVDPPMPSYGAAGTHPPSPPDPSRPSPRGLS